jgi:hypothetical protein
MELARRWILLIGVVLAVWTAKWASLAPLFIVRAVDFAAEQKDESSWTDRGRYLAQLPLAAYVEAKTKEAGLPVSGEAWAGFFREAGAASRGEISGKEWERRVPSDERRWRFTPYRVFFRPGEPPLDSVAANFSADEDVRYLILEEDGKTSYLSLSYQTYAGGDFGFGGGFSGSPEPPTRFLYPFRGLSLWVFFAGLAAYIFLPRPKKKKGALFYQTWRVVLGDVVAMILFAVFFALPIFVIGGSLQAITLAWPLALVAWPLAFAGIWLLRLGAWYASYQLAVTPDGFELSTYKSRRLFSFGEMAYLQPVVVKPPRWLVVASWLGALAGRGSARIGAAGRALMLGGSASNGVGIGLKDGSKAFFWVTDQMGGKALTNAERMVAALEKAGVPRKDEVKVISSVTLPVGEDARGRKIVEGSGLSLAVIFLFPIAALAVISILFTFGSSSGGPKAKTGEAAGESGSPAGSAASEDPEAAWVVSLGTGEITVGSAVSRTRDGGFIAAGYGSENGADIDAFLAKIDGRGTLLWNTSYPGEIDEFARFVLPAEDGGFFLAGEKRRVMDFAAGTTDAFLIRTGEEGEKTWETTAGAAEQDDVPLALAPGANGGVQMLLRTPAGAEVLEWDASGKEAGRRFFPLLSQFEEVEGIRAAAFAPDGGCVLTGEERSAGSGFLDLFIARIDREGRVVWKVKSGGPGKESGACVIPLSDGGFAAAGLVNVFDADDEDVYVLRTDAEGEVQGEYGHGGPGDQSGSAVMESADGSLLVFGKSKIGDEPRAIYRIAIVRGKTGIEDKLIAGGRYGAEAAAICPADDGGYVIVANRTTSGFSTTAVEVIKIRKK